MTPVSQLLQRIADAGIDFVIVGGFAAVTHGSSYVTRDVDLCLVLSQENIERLRRALADLNPRHRMTPQRLSFLAYPPSGHPVQNLYLVTDAGACGQEATTVVDLSSGAPVLLREGKGSLDPLGL